MLRLVERILPRRPPPALTPPVSEPVVIVITASHVLFCVALVLLVRVLRVLRRVHAAERAVCALTAERRLSRNVSALGADGVVSWDTSAERSPADSDSGSASDSSPAPSPSEADVEPPASPLALLVRDKRLPALDLTLVRRAQNKLSPCFSGPNIDELISRHQVAIAAMLAAAVNWPGFRAGSTGPGSHDEVFVLRFLLSHKFNVQEASGAMRTTLAWRARNRADEISAFVRSSPQSAFPAHEYVGRHFPTPITVPGGDWPPFMLINAAVLDPAELMKHISIEQYVVYSMYMSEKMAVTCDEITRRTRRLCKAVRVIAMSGLRLKHASMGFARAASAAAKDHVDCYPQNLGQLFLCNVPYAMKVVWDTAVAPLLPARVVEKTAVLNPAISSADLDELTDFIQLRLIPHAIYPGSTVVDAAADEAAASMAR